LDEIEHENSDDTIKYTNKQNIPVMNITLKKINQFKNESQKQII